KTTTPLRQASVKPPPKHMTDLSERQIQVLQRLFEAGFRPIAIPPYESALCLRRGECAAVLAPIENGGLRSRAPAAVLVGGEIRRASEAGRAGSVCVQANGIGRNAGADEGACEVSEDVGRSAGGRRDRVTTRPNTRKTHGQIGCAANPDLQIGTSNGKLKNPW